MMTTRVDGAEMSEEMEEKTTSKETRTHSADDFQMNQIWWKNELWNELHGSG